MEEKTEDLEEIRNRRKRINRMKSIIVMTITIWMVVSLMAIICLSVVVVRLNNKINDISSTRMEKVEDSNRFSKVQSINEGNKPTANSSTIVSNIDSKDNLAKKNDTHYVYLTFDGGPDDNTNAILDKLKEYQVKATFFVSGAEDEDSAAIYRRIVEEGHTLGMHSYCNKYSHIYGSKKAFEQDYFQLRNKLYETTGVTSKYYRFPGGSNNKVSNVDLTTFISFLKKQNVTYFDWNVSAGDESDDYTKDDVINNVISGVSKYKTSVVLLHDGNDKSMTVEALGPLLEQFNSMGAKVLPIDDDTDVIQYVSADSVE